eukprot:15464518-Alexandrium_andersonii.AAC.1
MPRVPDVICRREHRATTARNASADLQLGLAARQRAAQVPGRGAPTAHGPVSGPNPPAAGRHSTGSAMLSRARSGGGSWSGFCKSAGSALAFCSKLE